jgi:hypothetical protein
MRFSTVIALVSAAVVSAADIHVLVGDNGALAFSPTSVTALAGDIVHFEFHSKNHTVTQSTFASPCTLQTTPKQGIDSGFQPVAAGATSFPSWSITIDDPSAPLWFYCRQKTPVSHCQAGMVFAINPTPEKTFDAFQAAAKASANSPSSGAPSATSPASGSSTGTGSPQATQAGNGALGMSGNTASVLAVVGLLAGLVL